MMISTNTTPRPTRDARDALRERELPLLAREVSARQDSTQAARQGAPYAAPTNGYYNAEGEFVPYLRLDIDSFDSGRGCAP